MTAEAEQALSVLQPRGYRILVRVPYLDARMKSGLYRPDSSRALEQTASVLGEVVALGSTAYQDPDKFPDGPWCQVGDTIVMRAYSGTRLRIDDGEYRLINDDTVEGVVADPSRMERV
jgi:co-chaperonin GroES (HSP10)